MKLSQAFATFRQSTLAQLRALLEKENIPAFNAECVDIRMMHEAWSKDLSKGEALADWKRRERIAHLTAKRTQYVASLQAILQEEQMKRIKEYKGEVREEEENGKKFPIVYFPDGSKAKVAQAMWVDYKMYDRV